ncbi:FAD-dependent oxidoreductase [Candidatus Saccharibacteria bacterium]|nr:FAD-dependent oxidoreductase [Candidatus Saccharibacteria bacterium]
MTKPIHDLVIVGAGPSALTAAIYATRENIDTVLIEKGVIGGLLATIDKIENYPGFPEGIEGLTLAMDFQAQAEKFGAKIELAAVREIKKTKGTFLIKTDVGEFQSRTVLIASGSDHRKLGIPGEAGHAHYCATCDGAFYRDKKLVVIGGGNSAVQEAIFLTKFATHIDLVARVGIEASEILQKDLAQFVKNKQITVHENWTSDEIITTNGQITAVKMHATTAPDKQQELKTDGVFVFIGVVPNTGFLSGSGIKLDSAGHIITDENLMTNIPGIFASGDVRSGATKQVTSACGEGTTAALAIREYLATIA